MQLSKHPPPRLSTKPIAKMHGPKPISRIEITRQVWKNANSKCENCGSVYAMEEDHLIPRAKGGPTTIENIRLLCRSCNQRVAIEQFGLVKMESYLS